LVELLETVAAAAAAAELNVAYILLNGTGTSFVHYWRQQTYVCKSQGT